MDTALTPLRGGVLGAAELRRRLGISPATLMRKVRQAGPEILQIGRTRATRYGLRHVWPGLDASRFPVFRITESGTAESAGELFTLAAHQSVWMPEGGLSHGLPAALIDARPSGFLGRHFAAHHGDLRLPTRLSDWSDHHLLIALSRRGEDLTGNFLIGDESFARWQGLASPLVTPSAYPALATATIAGHPPGSSAGGERPKFGAFVDGRHVLVKFAVRAKASDEVSARWCDLLVLESLALSMVASRGIATARTALIPTESHYFLESERFDRVGLRGRVGVLSLAAVCEDLSDPWARSAVLLRNAGRLSIEESRRLQWLDAFGSLIANTDRHPHNVVFFQKEKVLRLAPAFDQVPMLYAPTPDGQIPHRDFRVPHATADTLEVWDDARSAAGEFWRQASDTTLLSEEMRRLSAIHAKGNM